MPKLYQGTSIIEVVIAAALISISVIAALSLSNHSQKQTTYSKDLAEASKYLSEGADWLRAERSELGWATVAAKVESDNSSGQTTYCLNTLPGADTLTDFTDLIPSVCNPGTVISGTIFQREIIVNPPDLISGILKATLVVSWVEKDEHRASLDVELTQW